MVNSDQFHTTHWSVVLTAKGDDTAAREALSTLCETYYQPVLRYVERQTATDSMRCYGGRDARDLTHDFFTQLLEGDMFATLRREGAPFRTDLLGAVRYFLLQIRAHESAEKRGRDFSQSDLPLESLPTTRENDMDNDAFFDRDWAQTMVKRAVASLDDPPETHVKKLLPWLTRELDAASRGRIAAELEMSDVAVKVALHRLRKRFRQTIRTQIAETVKAPSDIDAELDHLIRALNG